MTTQPKAPCKCEHWQVCMECNPKTAAYIEAKSRGDYVQPKALALAECLKDDELFTVSRSEIAYELERQHAEIERLTAELANRHFEFKEHLKTLGQVRRERDEALAVNAGLLEVCKELAESAEYWSEYDVPLGIAGRLGAAISKAEKA